MRCPCFLLILALTFLFYYFRSNSTSDSLVPLFNHVVLVKSKRGWLSERRFTGYLFNRFLLWRITLICSQALKRVTACQIIALLRSLSLFTLIFILNCCVWNRCRIFNYLLLLWRCRWKIRFLFYLFMGITWCLRWLSYFTFLERKFIRLLMGLIIRVACILTPTLHTFLLLMSYHRSAWRCSICVFMLL